MDGSRSADPVLSMFYPDFFSFFEARHKQITVSLTFVKCVVFIASSQNRTGQKNENTQEPLTLKIVFHSDIYRDKGETFHILKHIQTIPNSDNIFCF